MYDQDASSAPTAAVDLVRRVPIVVSSGIKKSTTHFIITRTGPFSIHSSSKNA